MSDSLVKERNCGVEALRIVAMMLICTLHVLGHGGILTAAAPDSAQYRVSWLMESAAFCGVNCYALISGFVGVKSQFKWSRLLLIWLQVVAYELVISLYFQIVIPSVMVPAFWGMAVTPILSNEYWYISAYAGMFLFTPMINSAFQTLSKRRMTQVVCVLFVLFGFLQSIFSTPSFGLGIGYCVIWLLLLYIFGAYIRCYMPPLGLKKLWLLPLFAVSVIPSWISRVWGDGRFLSYCSPSVLVSALALTLFFINTDFKSKTVRRIIFAVSPTTLGVYLIHTQPLVFRIYLKDFFAWLAGYSTGIMIVYVLLFALAIFVVCSLIDMVRIKIFELLHINKIAKQLDSLLADK